jgi:signal transduction histidine kinase
MTLTSKFFFWVAALLLGILALGAVSLWNLSTLFQGTHAAAAEYEAMDRAKSATGQVAWLRDELRGPRARVYRDAKYFVPIREEIQQMAQALGEAARVDDGEATAERLLANEAGEHLEAAARNAANMSSEQAAAELERARQALVAVSELVPVASRHHVLAGQEKLHNRLIWTCVWLLVVLAISTIIHLRQYRALIRPLRWLREEMRRSTASEYHLEVQARGDQEFKDVANAFNGLARALAEMYRSLEAKVIARSRELVRSERLASVGFLAAGVAHEINNPLGVISGYAEMAGKTLRRMLLGPAVATNGADADTIQSEADAEAEAQALSSALDAQTIIRDEAFRCKEITSRLLSLARGGGDGREPLRLDDVARQVTTLTRGLRNYREREIVLDFKPSAPLEVVANPTEMKQVFMNLTVNALEASSSDHGRVRIGGRRSGEWVELFVEDNGKGMTPDMLERVFEPFFTAKRGAGEPGTGLGLSITHAIVESHGGRISAESRGPGHGSRFTVRLPARAAALVT